MRDAKRSDRAPAGRVEWAKGYEVELTLSAAKMDFSIARDSLRAG
jgi:hypothetical protein